jgi:hypothetical protein
MNSIKPCIQSLTYPDVPLLHKSYCLPHGFTKFQPNQHHRKSSPAKGRHCQPFALDEALLGRNKRHVVELLDESVCNLDSDLILHMKKKSEILTSQQSHSQTWKLHEKTILENRE